MVSVGPISSGRRQPTSKPYWARRAEVRIVRWSSHVFRRLGWRERIEPFVGYGAAPDVVSETSPDHAQYRRVSEQGEVLPAWEGQDAGWVRVLARVMLSPKRRVLLRRTSVPGRAEALRAMRGWRNFFTVQAPGVTVTVEVAGHRYLVRSDPGGYIDVVIPSRAEAGWHEAVMTTAHGGQATLGVRVLGSGTSVGLVSDIDDTAIVTSLPRPLLAIWNSFILHEDARTAVPGMARLYRQLGSHHEDFPVFYLSTGAWNVVPTMLRFFAHHGFPHGPMLMTDFGPTNTGIFRSGREHKERSLRRLAQDFPAVKWYLVGDDGQHDPVIYRDFATELPQHVAAIAIRQLTFSEAVLAHGLPTATHANKAAEESVESPAVETVFVVGPDGDALARAMRERGVLG